MVRDKNTVRRPVRFEIADVVAIVALIVILGGALFGLIASRNRAFAEGAKNWLETRGIAATAFTAERHDVDDASRSSSANVGSGDLLARELVLSDPASRSRCGEVRKTGYTRR